MSTMRAGGTARNSSLWRLTSFLSVKGNCASASSRGRRASAGACGRGGDNRGSARRSRPGAGAGAGPGPCGGGRAIRIPAPVRPRSSSCRSLHGGQLRRDHVAHAVLEVKGVHLPVILQTSAGRRRTRTVAGRKIGDPAPGAVRLPEIQMGTIGALVCSARRNSGPWKGPDGTAVASASLR